MNTSSVAPCGVICDLCMAFQRKKNKCDGCKSEGTKPYHCTVCSIKFCPEKKGNPNLICHKCPSFPCKRIKSLDKRYREKYGMSPVQNLLKIKEIGVRAFVKSQREFWKCGTCGNFVCVHKETCLSCGAPNRRFPT